MPADRAILSFFFLLEEWGDPLAFFPLADFHILS